MVLEIGAFLEIEETLEHELAPGNINNKGMTSEEINYRQCYLDLLHHHKSKFITLQAQAAQVLETMDFEALKMQLKAKTEKDRKQLEKLERG